MNLASRKAVAEQQQQEHHAQQQQQQQPQAPSRVDEVKANAQEVGGASPGGSERSVAERERQRLREQERRRRLAVSFFVFFRDSLCFDLWLVSGGKSD